MQLVSERGKWRIAYSVDNIKAGIINIKWRLALYCAGYAKCYIGRKTFNGQC